MRGAFTSSNLPATPLEVRRRAQQVRDVFSSSHTRPRLTPGHTPHEAHKLQAAKIEAAKWYDPSDRRTFGNIITEARFWTTSMNRDHFMGSLDPRNYE